MVSIIKRRNLEYITFQRFHISGSDRQLDPEPVGIL